MLQPMRDPSRLFADQVVIPASYIIWKEGNGIYAKNGVTGQIEFQGKAGVDDTDILQNTVNNGGKIVILSDLTIGDSITLRSDIIIDLNGNTIKNEAGGLDLFSAPPGSNLRNITIENGEIDSEGANGTPIALYNSSDILLKNLYIHDVNISPGGYGIYLYECNYAWLEKIKVKNISERDGIQLKGSKNVWIKDCYCENTGIFGIDIHASDTLTYCENVNVINPIIVNGNSAGMNIEDYNIKVVNPTIIGSSAEGITIRGDGTTVEIISPKIYNVGTVGINTYYATDIDMIKIVGGIIDTAGSHGIYIKHTNDLKIIGTTVRNAGAKGIYISANDAELYSVTSESNTEDGIFIDANILRAKIIGSRIINNGGYGIREYSGADYSIITNNILYNNTNGNILKSGANTLVDNNIG